MHNAQRFLNHFMVLGQEQPKATVPDILQDTYEVFKDTAMNFHVKRRTEDMTAPDYFVVSLLTFDDDSCLVLAADTEGYDIKGYERPEQGVLTFLTTARENALELDEEEQTLLKIADLMQQLEA